MEALVELAYKLLQAVRRQVARLVVDRMEAFRQSAWYPERLGRLFSALTNELSGAGANRGVRTSIRESAGSASGDAAYPSEAC